jgi:small basic protein (TIGR04137 family)
VEFLTPPCPKQEQQKTPTDEETVMSLDRSLRSANALLRHRNVLTRAERLEVLKEEEKWTGTSSVFGLPKVGHRKAAVAKKEETPEAAAAAAAAVPAAGAGAAPAPAAKGAGAKGGAPAAKGAAPAAKAAPKKK